MPLGMEVGIGPGQFVFDGDPAPPQFLSIVVKRQDDQDATRPRRRCVRWVVIPLKRGTTPQFSVHVYCDQTAGWMKMPLGMEVDLGQGPSPPPAKGAR